jgi:hypothetical protein
VELERQHAAQSAEHASLGVWFRFSDGFGGNSMGILWVSLAGFWMVFGSEFWSDEMKMGTPMDI